MKRFVPLLFLLLAPVLPLRAATTADDASRDAIDRAVAAVYPALVRIHVVAEEGSEAQAGEAISNIEDKSIFMGDFNSGNWYGIK